MKKSKFTEQLIAFALKQAEIGITEIRRLRQLEDENSRLKQIVAYLTLDKQMLQDVFKKNV